MKRCAVTICFTLIVSGCAIGPDYKRPEIKAPAAFRGQTEAPGAKSLAETLSTPNVSGGPCRLPGSSNHGNAGRGKRVSDGSEGEIEFKLRIERRGIGIVYCEKIGDDAKSALLLFDLYLLNGHLIGAFGGHSNGGVHFFDPELANVQDFALARLQDDDG